MQCLLCRIIWPAGSFLGDHGAPFLPQLSGHGLENRERRGTYSILRCSIVSLNPQSLRYISLNAVEVAPKSGESALSSYIDKTTS